MTCTMPETLALFDLPEADVQLDLFADADAEELPAGTRVRVARRGGATGTVEAKDPIGAWFGRAHDARPTVSIKFDGAGHGLNYREDVEVLDQPEVAPYRVDLGNRWYVVTRNPAGWPEPHTPVDGHMGNAGQPLCPALPVWKVERTGPRGRLWGHISYYCAGHLPAEFTRPLPDLPDAAPIWVRTCNHVGCILTSSHTHGIRH